MAIGVQINFLRDKLRAVVHPDTLRHPVLGHRQVEGDDHIVALVTESHPEEGTNTANNVID